MKEGKVLTELDEVKKVIEDVKDNEIQKEIYDEILVDINGKTKSGSTQGGFLLKQRAFVKVYLIMMAQDNELYGLKIVDKLQEKFRDVKYVPGNSEVYKTLYHLLEIDVLVRTKQLIEGTKRASVQVYTLADTDYARGYARAYKRLLHIELQRSKKIIEKGLKDLEKSLGPLN